MLKGYPWNYTASLWYIFYIHQQVIVELQMNETPLFSNRNGFCMDFISYRKLILKLKIDQVTNFLSFLHSFCLASRNSMHEKIEMDSIHII
jgi:hypothetical protein